MAGLLIYRFVFLTCFVPLLLVRNIPPLMRSAEARRDLAERFGFGAMPTRPVVWLHGASLGEIGPARALAEAILARRDDLDLLITAHSPFAVNLAKGWNLPRTTCRPAPIDTRWAVARWLTRMDCRLHVTIENELWPNRFALLHRRRVPIAAISARMSARSVRHWRLLGDFAPSLLRMVSHVAPQSEESRANLIAAGLPADRLGATINLKGLARMADPPADKLAAARPAYQRERTILAASTHEGEEEIVLKAFRRVLETHADAKLILAPRQLARGNEVAEIVVKNGFDLHQRSQGAPPGGQVYLADTLHEMPLWYALAGVCFVGGSITDRGGHTPYEPAQVGLAILSGPHVENARAAYDELVAAGAARIIAPDAMAGAFTELLDAPGKARAMGERALATLAARSDPLSPFIDHILP